MQPVRFPHTTARFESFLSPQATAGAAVQVMPYMMYLQVNCIESRCYNYADSAGSTALTELNVVALRTTTGLRDRALRSAPGKEMEA